MVTTEVESPMTAFSDPRTDNSPVAMMLKWFKTDAAAGDVTEPSKQRNKSF